ncbi:MAG: ABC transporter permease [Clostridium sp.]|uniref:ABC transporter permease n=1 Tax=Clostridium sp. TaxID=1506 RepID=UPI003D6CBAFB
MHGFGILFRYGIKKRIKDSFLIGYGIIYPLILIGLFGYIASNYYSGEQGITSFYYYTIVSIPFCTFLGAVSLIYIAKEECLAKCGKRFIIAPIGNGAIVLSKIIPSTIAMTIFNIIIMIICRFIFKVDFKGNFIELILLLMVIAFMSCSIGTFIGICTKDFMAVKNFVSMPILIMAALGGSFFPIGSLGNVVNIISYISPLTWINRGVFNMMNDNSMTLYFIAMLLSLITGLIFTISSIKGFKKEAFL